MQAFSTGMLPLWWSRISTITLYAPEFPTKTQYHISNLKKVILQRFLEILKQTYRGKIIG